jgi:hypothetical protein
VGAEVDLTQPGLSLGQLTLEVGAVEVQEQVETGLMAVRALLSSDTDLNKNIN